MCVSIFRQADSCVCLFFFQAEDGIRDLTVTGVQTCALPIVGMLMRWGIEQGRKTRPKLKIGICGEHGGDADSVKFCHQVGMDYVSASPFRVPIARLAAAQVVVEEKQAERKKGK